MAHSFSQAKRALAFVLHRRCYAVPSDASSSSSSSVRGGMDRIGSKSRIEKPVTKNGSGPNPSSWAPDPVTGFYRPINHRDEIDPVELRQTLLNHKIR